LEKNVGQVFLICLGVLLLIAAASDFRRYIIPNWLSAAILALYILHTAMTRPPLSAIGVHIAVAVAVLAVSALLFVKGMFGGGDVKLLSSLALWVGLVGLPRLLLTMAIAGGIVALFFVAVRWRTNAGGGIADRRIPYGIAIALAGLDYCLLQVHLAFW
jgi:prepilin peptidase CpaA